MIRFKSSAREPKKPAVLTPKEKKRAKLDKKAQPDWARFPPVKGH